MRRIEFPSGSMWLNWDLGVDDGVEWKREEDEDIFYTWKDSL